MGALSSRAHVILLREGGEAVVLLREVRNGSVCHRAPGVALEPGETPGRAAARAALEHFGLAVEVGELVYADTEQGADHYFFLGAATVGSTDVANAPPDAVVLRRSALPAYRVEPFQLGRRLFSLEPASLR